MSDFSIPIKLDAEHKAGFVSVRIHCDHIMGLPLDAELYNACRKLIFSANSGAKIGELQERIRTIEELCDRRSTGL